MTAGIAAFRSGEQPHIIQVYEVGTGTMMAAKGAVKPVYQLMDEAGADFDPSAYLGTVTGYYTTAEGQMLSMPFNSSTPVMYYNKEAFAAAGLDPEDPPTTWEEVAEVSRILVDRGVVTAGFTTTWPSWLMVENFSAIHDIPFPPDPTDSRVWTRNSSLTKPPWSGIMKCWPNGRKRTFSSTADARAKRPPVQYG